MIKNVFFLLAMFTCIFASCSDGGSEEPVIPPTQKPEVNNTPTITIDPTIQSSGLSFDTSASEKSITFSTTSDWTLSIAETRSGTEWCTASPTSGGKGTATVKFKTTENTEAEDRTVTVTIKAGTASKTFTVTQSAKEQEEGSYENGVVTLVEAGTLKKLLGDNYMNITSLKVVGAINGSDVYYLRKMLGGSNFSEADWGKLTTLDLSETTIVEGGEWYYYYDFLDDYLCTSNNLIGKFMFYKCANLQNIILPDNVTEIHEYAFADCSSLTSIIIPDGVTSIDYCTFAGCSSLTSATIGNSVTSIAMSAFLKCSSLESVTIPDNVTEIGECAFMDCSSLTSVTISNSVTSIDHHVFEGCSSLESVTIPDNITSIGYLAFGDCSSLTSIAIPSSVTEIYANAFADCSSLKSIYCYIQKLSGISSLAFNRINPEATLYVPARCGSSYKSLLGSTVKNIIEMEE